MDPSFDLLLIFVAQNLESSRQGFVETLNLGIGFLGVGIRVWWVGVGFGCGGILWKQKKNRLPCLSTRQAAASEALPENVNGDEQQNRYCHGLLLSLNGQIASPCFCLTAS